MDRVTTEMKVETIARRRGEKKTLDDKDIQNVRCEQESNRRLTKPKPKRKR